jgi:hypothetical protein
LLAACTPAYDETLWKAVIYQMPFDSEGPLRQGTPRSEISGGVRVLDIAVRRGDVDAVLAGSGDLRSSYSAWNADDLDP